MKIAYFSPMPPAKTGVADYSAALVQELRKSGTVEIGAEDVQPAIYHLGNNSLHRAIYSRALDHPGIAVLHDAALNHFFLGALERERYIEEFVYNYGEWSRGLAGDLWINRARSAADPRYFAYPMLRRIAGQSRAVIVHNPAAEQAVKRHASEARVIEIPHLFAAPRLPDAVDVLRFRAALGLEPRTLLVGVFGHLRESKRIPVLLRAMERAWMAGVNARLLIAGAFASSDLERFLAPRLGDSRIIRAGHLFGRDFWRWAAATDLCVNLRFPAAGETSGIAIRMMGIGKAVALTDGEEIARVPENACVRIDHGPCEEDSLTAAIVWLAGDREAAQEIGRRAARYIACAHSIEKAAARYWDAINTL